MKTLFDLQEINPEAVLHKWHGKHCRNCRYIANLNPYSNRYWYCTITPNNRTRYGVKAVKRMNQACHRFESNND
jgi:hypothetical protein